MVTVHIPSALRVYSGGQRSVEVETSVPTLGGVLEALRAVCPGVPERALDERGVLRQHVNVFVDGEVVRRQGGLDTRVRPGAEVWILPAVSGGL